VRLPFLICETHLVSERVSLPLVPTQFASLAPPSLLELMVTSL
jgi:hypothetical protein